jgi:hypothetical protein
MSTSLNASLSSSSLETCPICLDEVDPQNNFSCITIHKSNIPHIFHKFCLKTAIELQVESDKTCPLCRRSITPIQFTPPNSRPSSSHGRASEQSMAIGPVQQVNQNHLDFPRPIVNLTVHPDGSRSYTVRFIPINIGNQ